MGLSYQPLYIATAGAYANQRKLEVISNNLANASTHGYKRDIVAFEGLIEPASPITPINPKLYFDLHNEQVSQRMVLFDETYTDFSQGALIETGNTLDIAISGDGFFAVQTEDGIKFTRAGNFTLSPDGYIITPQGYKLLGKKGEPIRIPFEEWAPQDIVITPDGGVFLGVRHGEERKSIFIDQIGVYSIPEGLARKVGENLFDVDDISYVQDSENFEVLQGFLESSNVNPINEMVSLIEVQRAYEANTRVITSVDSTLSTSIRDLGRV
jgi:flagellar basal-body rod protein FlgG